MCIVLLPPGVNPIAVNKYIYLKHQKLQSWASPIQLPSSHLFSLRTTLMLCYQCCRSQLPRRFSTKTLSVVFVCPIQATCPFHRSPLNFIIVALLHDLYKSRTYSCNIQHCQLTGSNLYPNTVLSTLFSTLVIYHVRHLNQRLCSKLCTFWLKKTKYGESKPMKN